MSVTLLSVGAVDSASPACWNEIVATNNQCSQQLNVLDGGRKSSNGTSESSAFDWPTGMSRHFAFRVELPGAAFPANMSTLANICRR